MPPENDSGATATAEPSADPKAAAKAQLLKDVIDGVEERVTPRLQRIEDAQRRDEEERTARKAAIEQMQAEIRALAQSQRKAALPGWDHDPEPGSPRNPNLGKLVIGHLKGWQGECKNWKTEYAYANEMAAQALVRAQQSGIGSQGGVLIGTDVFPGIIKPLKARSVAVQATGLNFHEGLTSNLKFNRSEGGISAHWKGESKPITESEEAFEELEMRPHEAVGLARTSMKQLLQDSGAMSTWLESRLGQEIGLLIDKAFFKGTGGAQPLGILQAKAPDDASTSFATFKTDSADADLQTVTGLLKDMLTALKARNAYYEYGPVWWFSTPQGFGLFRNVLDANGNRVQLFEQPYVADTSAGIASNDRFYGHRYAESTQLTFGSAADDLLLVAMGACHVGLWNTIEILANPMAGSVYVANDLWIRAVAYADSAIVRGDHLQRASSWDNNS